jgi:opacity protein-like surface antigen
MRKLLLIFFMLSTISIAMAENPGEGNNQGALRAGFVYFPTGSVKMPSDDVRLTFYDSFAYKFGAEYSISEYVSVGPGIEYLNKKVNPDATFSTKISLVSLYLDARLSYPMTDSGKSCFVIGLGTGMVRLTEKGSGSENGPSIYTIVGFNIGLGTKMGLDLLYRYGFTRVDLEKVREYRFTSWALQTGLSYRLKL